jgi:hypothetical protein
VGLEHRNEGAVCSSPAVWSSLVQPVNPLHNSAIHSSKASSIKGSARACCALQIIFTWRAVASKTIKVGCVRQFQIIAWKKKPASTAVHRRTPFGRRSLTTRTPMCIHLSFGSDFMTEMMRIHCIILLQCNLHHSKWYHVYPQSSSKPQGCVNVWSCV